MISHFGILFIFFLTFAHFSFFFLTIFKNLATPNDITAEWLTSALHDFKSLCSDIKITKLTKSDVEGIWTILEMMSLIIIIFS